MTRLTLHHHPPTQLRDQAPARWGRQVSDEDGRTLYVYLDGDGRLMVKPGTSGAHVAHLPVGGRSMVLYRLLMWLTWGRPPLGKTSIATHFACDHHGCLNPAHGRWGTQQSNRAEFAILRAFKAEVALVPTHLKAQYTRDNHPMNPLLARQGFNWPAVAHRQ